MVLFGRRARVRASVEETGISRFECGSELVYARIGTGKTATAMALKSIQRSATVAFAPMAPVMAVGTMAGAIDPSFSSSAHLELLKLDFASSDLDMPVLSSAGVPERFNRLSWSNVGAGSAEEFPYGVIAGGLADGSLHFWNPHKLLRSVSRLHSAYFEPLDW